jgi:homoserine dehydrogenase
MSTTLFEKTTQKTPQKKARKIRVALFGFGVVGSGVWEVLQSNRQEFLRQFGVEFDIAGICVRDMQKQRLANVPAELLSDKIEQLLEDDSIDIVLELIGGRYEAANLIDKSLRGRKHVITANKLVLAYELPRLASVADRNGVELLYSASVCGSVPVIAALDELRTRDTIVKITGIVNGSTNFILTMMSEEGVSFERAVDEARRRGFLEADASLDLSGADAAQKLSVLAYHAFGQHVKPHEIETHGIENITSGDIRRARDDGQTIKLLATAYLDGERVRAVVSPQRVPLASIFAHTRDEFNALEIEARHAGPQLLYGKGAGCLPTASAVISDLVSLVRGE